jgi:hypothetical protein
MCVFVCVCVLIVWRSGARVCEIGFAPYPSMPTSCRYSIITPVSSLCQYYIVHLTTQIISCTSLRRLYRAPHYADYIVHLTTQIIST